MFKKFRGRVKKRLGGYKKRFSGYRQRFSRYRQRFSGLRQKYGSKKNLMYLGILVALAYVGYKQRVWLKQQFENFTKKST